ncbi:MAG TPA: sulfatase [Solirubrobacterales bacterium]|nr:sulfatase [Solirubrobacterales bacterium]
MRGGGNLTTLLLGLFAALALAVPSASQARPADVGRDGRPNILVVMTDDMTQSDLPFMPKTRKLLAKQGTSFTNTITSFPLCCPSRSTFLTGQYAHNHGVTGNFYPEGWYGMQGRKNTLATWLDRAGYRTGLIGKWLNGYGALDGHGEIPPGFDDWHGLLDVSAYDYYNFEMNSNERLLAWGDPGFARKLVGFANVEVTPPDSKSAADVLAQLRKVMGPPPYTYWGAQNPDQYSPDVTGRFTQRLIGKGKHSRKPFFIWWAPASPHREDVSTTLMGRPGPDPRPPERYEQLSQSFQLPRPPSFNEADVSDKPTVVTSKTPPLTDEEIAQLQLDYEGRGGSMRAVDDWVGRIVKTLRRTRQLGNTVILFTSDNGWLNGQHRIPGDKFLPYEESLRVPLIIRGPGFGRGKKIKQQVANIDMAPTLAAVARAKPRRRMDGISLPPALRGHQRVPKRALEIEAPRPLFTGAIPNNAWDRPYVGVRTQRYTFVLWTETGEEELYDRRTDPFQLQNVAHDPAYAGIRARLIARMQRLATCRGRSCDVKP